MARYELFRYAELGRSELPHVWSYEDEEKYVNKTSRRNDIIYRGVETRCLKDTEGRAEAGTSLHFGQPNGTGWTSELCPCCIERCFRRSLDSTVTSRVCTIALKEGIMATKATVYLDGTSATVSSFYGVVGRDLHVTVSNGILEVKDFVQGADYGNVLFGCSLHAARFWTLE